MFTENLDEEMHILFGTFPAISAWKSPGFFVCLDSGDPVKDSVSYVAPQAAYLQWCCVHRQGLAFNLGHIPSLHTRTLACSHT